MKSDRAKELFRIRAAQKVGLEQFGHARSEARAKMWKKRAGGGERRERLPANPLILKNAHQLFTVDFTQ